MKWIGYGLQGIGGVMALTGMGLFAVGKLVEHAASREDPEAPEVRGSSELEEIAAKRRRRQR